MKVNIIFVLIFLNMYNVFAVHIMNLRVPSSYALSKQYCQPLILDCEYEFDIYDLGFVLKWYHNSHLIYQWIPPRKPYIFSNYNINANFIVTDEPKFKHRALQLQPSINLTGDWMCSVQTYHTQDRQIKAMNIIVPEKSFELFHQNISEDSQFFLIVCNVVVIYPEPQLQLTVGNDFKIISEVESECDENGFFNKSIRARVGKKYIKSPSQINCVLEINGTDYIKKKKFIYYDQDYDKNFESKFERFSMRSTGKKSYGLATFSFSGFLVPLALFFLHHR